jgi:hypothetical protein
MSKPFNPDILSDRERILMRIIEQLSSTQLMRSRNRSWSSVDYADTSGGHYVHFAYWDDPKPGDLVLAKTGPLSPWKIGFYVEPLSGDFGGAVIREIGSERLCNYTNESFVPIVGLSTIDLLESEQRQFYYKVLKAFHRGDEYLYRFGGIRFKDNVATVTIRERWGGLGADSVPFTVDIEMRKRMAIKAILAKLREGGYGTKSFRPVEAINQGE